MLHIRSSIKGIFLLENNGIPSTIITDLGEDIVDGSLCVDRTNAELYILKTGSWELVGNGTNGTGGAIDLSYKRVDPTVTTVGGISAGTTPNYDNITDVFDAMFYPFQNPSNSISGGTLYEKGLTITGNYPYSINLNDGIVNTRSINLNGSNVFTPSTNNGTYSGTQGLNWVNSPNGSSVYWRHQYQYFVTFTNTTSKSSTTNIEFAAPTYYGVLDIGNVNETNIKNLTKRIRKEADDNNLSFSPTLQRYIYAYPTSYGDLTQIIDPNGFNITAGFDKSVISFTLSDASSESYNVYVSNSDTTQTSFQIDFKY